MQFNTIAGSYLIKYLKSLMYDKGEVTLRSASVCSVVVTSSLLLSFYLLWGRMGWLLGGLIFVVI